MSSLVLVAYEGSDPNGSALGTISDAYEKKLTIEDNAVGAGSFKIHPASSQLAWCAQGNYVRVRQNTSGGALLGGFWLEGEQDTILSPDEEGGKDRSRGGRGPIAILRKGIVWRESVLSAEPDEPITQPGRGRWFWKDAQPAAVLIRLLKEAKERGCFPAVTWDFSRTHDSDGDPWEADLKGKFDIPIGRNLVEVVGILREADFKVDVSPSFVISAWPEPHEHDIHSTVAFTVGTNIRDTSDRQVQARRAASVVLVGGQEDSGRNRYQPAHNASIETLLGERIESFIEYPRTPNLAIMKRVGLRRLRRWKKQLDGPLTIGVIDGAKQAVIDYTAGDTVGLVGLDGVSASDRIVSLTLEETESGEYDPILQFGDLGEDSGVDQGGEARSGGVNPGPGGGDDPDKGGGGGGGPAPTPAPVDTGEYVIENWNDAASTLPSLVADQTTVATGLVQTVIMTGLPDLDRASPTRWLMIGYALANPDAGGFIPAQFATLGFTALQTDLNRAGTNSAGVFVQPLDGTQTYDAEDNVLEIDVPSPGGTGIWYAALVEGVSQWTSSEDASGSGNSGPVSGWTGENELAIIFDMGNAALSGSVSPPYFFIENQNSGGAALGVTTAQLTGAFNPPSYTHSGTAEYAVTTAGRYSDPAWGVTVRGGSAGNGAPWEGANHWITGVDQGSATFTTTGTKGVITIGANNSQAYAELESDSLDDPNGEPWGVWADADGTMRCRFQVNRLGVLTDTFGNIVWWEVEAAGYKGWFLVHLGDAVARGYMTTGQRGIVVLQGTEPASMVASPFVVKSLAATTDYDVRMDFRGSRARMKLWAASANEPVDYDIDVAKTYDPDTGDVSRFFMRVWGGINTSNLAVSYDTLWGGQSTTVGGGSSSGTITMLPRGDGSTVTWHVPPFPGRAIVVWVDGMSTVPSAVDADAGSFTFSRAPAKGAFVAYVVI